MTLKEKLKRLEPGRHLLIVSPVIEHIMTGTQKVGVERDGTVECMYSDGSVETRMGNDAILGMDADELSVLELVSYIQEGRK
jgi:hypothetical protein